MMHVRLTRQNDRNANMKVTDKSMHQQLNQTSVVLQIFIRILYI